MGELRGMSPRLSPGDQVPQVVLARLLPTGEVQPLALREMLNGKRGVLVGIPGAFTPVCTQTHIPELVTQADRLRRAGFDHVLCIVPDNPWVLNAWAPLVDPQGKLTFLSDGNLKLARALGVTLLDQRNFLGECPTRYMLVAEDGVITRLHTESHPNRPHL
ncbi:MAG: redoxin family protein [Hyphomonadaceae bacterium]